MSNLNFSISELIHSDTAILHKINNMPDINSLDNLLNLIFYVLQPLRSRLNKPIVITSGYRSKALNRLVKGSETSQHIKGMAADIKVPGMTVQELIDFIKATNIEYDQLINEYNQWVHISFNKNNNRNQYLEMK